MESDHLVVPEAGSDEAVAVDDAVREDRNMRPYVRDGILGMNDGLVSIMLMFVTIVTSKTALSNMDILFTGVACAFAGAASMALGEFLATKSQNQVHTSHQDELRRRLSADKSYYRVLVRQKLTAFGLAPSMCTTVAEAMEANDIDVTIRFLSSCSMVGSSGARPWPAALGAPLRRYFSYTRVCCR